MFAVVLGAHFDTTPLSNILLLVALDSPHYHYGVGFLVRSPGCGLGNSSPTCPLGASYSNGPRTWTKSSTRVAGTGTTINVPSRGRADRGRIGVVGMSVVTTAQITRK